MIFTIFSAWVSDKRAAKNREILGENIHQAAIDGAVARHYAIAEVVFFVQAEVFGAVHHKLANFLKRAFVHQQVDPFAGRELAFFVLGINAVLPATKQRFGIFAFENFDFA